jgi:hypothetical protein
VLDKIVQRDAVVSVTGKTSLAELTQLLACCALYVGNNSGPKHIAAAIGAPTIGVHSGVIDSAEWAPIGKRALALRRNMTCSPCYLAREVDCPRNLACLRQLEPVSVWQACRALLATTHMPVYDTAAREPQVQQAADPAIESASPPTRRKPRAGRKQAAGKATPPVPQLPVSVEAVEAIDAPIEPLAEGAVDAADAPDPDVSGSDTSVANTLGIGAPSAARERQAADSGPSDPDAAASTPATDALDPLPEPAPQAPEGGHDAEQAATPTDEPVET